MRALLFMLLAAGAALPAAGESFDSWTAKAAKAFQRGDHRVAVECLSSALRFWTPSDGEGRKARALYQRARVRRAQRRPGDAVGDLSEAIDLKPRAVYYVERGEAYLDLSLSTAAIGDFYRAVSLDLGNARAYYDRGLAYQRLGDWRFAREDYGTACRLGLAKACSASRRAKDRLAQKPPDDDAPREGFVAAHEDVDHGVQIRPRGSPHWHPFDARACRSGLETCLRSGRGFGDCVDRAAVCEFSGVAGCCPERCVRGFDLAAARASEAEAYREYFGRKGRCAAAP